MKWTRVGLFYFTPQTFAGSGTTLVAAKKLERNFIGIEKDAGYWRIAAERVGA
ncbi:MAG: DNA methyltransferase [Sporomusa sp.]